MTTAGANSSSAELLKNASQGDQHARAELFARYRGRLRRMVALRMDRRIAARVDPSDIVQDAIHDAIERLPEYFAAGQIAFYPWLRRIAWDRLIDMYRTHIGAERRSVLKEERAGPDLKDESVAELAQRLVADASNPSHRAMLDELQSRMEAALSQLRPPDREILVLRYLEQLDVEEISQVLGISRTAVTSRHLRALQRLRTLVGPDLRG